MSKLRDRIRDMSRRHQATFGFTAVRTEERPPRQMLVIAEVTGAAQAAVAVEAGVDVLLHTGPVDALAEVVGTAASCIVGCAIEAATAADAAAIIEAGGHFLAFSDRQTDAAALLDQRLGYVAMVGVEEDADLRLLRPLDLDAALIPSPAEQMTVRDQLRLRRMGDLTRKPLISRLDHTVPATTLEIWRDAGVTAVLVPAGQDVLAQVIAAAEAVPRPRTSGERPEAVLPAAHAPFGDEDDD